LILPFVNTAAMNARLAGIARAAAPGAHAVLVLDGAGWHAARTLSVPDNVTLLHLPPYAPELNPVENVWTCLRANRLAISVFDSYDEIVHARCTAWNFFANDPMAIAAITSPAWAQIS
jgi:transposase